MVLALIGLGAARDLCHVRPCPAPPVAGLATDAAPAARAESTTAVPPRATLDLNRAGAGELDALPGIGPVLAARIVEHRRVHGPFRSPDELLAVRGIGPRLLERLRPRVAVPAPGLRSAAPPLQFAKPHP